MFRTWYDRAVEGLGRFVLPQIAAIYRTSSPSTRRAKRKSRLFELYMQSKRKYINRTKILERDQYICAYCLGDATEVEHVVPWDWSHCNDEDNLVASCVECNRIAGDRMFSSFDEKRAFILIIRSGKRWTRKLAIKYQVFRCTDCKRIFVPLKDGATNFLCPSCTAKEYAT